MTRGVGGENKHKHRDLIAAATTLKAGLSFYWLDKKKGENINSDGNIHAQRFACV
jgi:hypothetical protein